MLVLAVDFVVGDWLQPEPASPKSAVTASASTEAAGHADSTNGPGAAFRNDSVRGERLIRVD
jgi:hypothetical protein